MKDKFTGMPHSKAYIDFAKETGKLYLKNHSYGIGGINYIPMADNVAEGMKKLKPKLIRIFIQEFFFIYDENGNLDFTLLDPYMKAVNSTGADIMASICIKPKLLYPVVDENIWMPNDTEKWKFVISEMVRRYSVENKYVTYWGIGNEINIGEYGGCPYKISDVNDYFEYYKLTADAVLTAYPEGKVGGPSFAGVSEETFKFFNEFIPLCKNGNVQLDFISYNIYSDSIGYHMSSARKIKDIAAEYDDGIEVYVTEMNIGIGNEISLEEKAYDSKRAAALAAIILDYNEKVPEVGTFQYHIYDQYCDPYDFEPFYARYRYMANHWNDEPHRLGLFDEDGRERPQYQMYKLLNEMAEDCVEAVLDNADIHIAASKDEKSAAEKVTVFMANYSGESSSDTIVSLYLKNCFSGMARLTVQRIDNTSDIGVKITENRRTYVHSDFWFSVFVPADSCVKVTLTLC